MKLFEYKTDEKHHYHDFKRDSDDELAYLNDMGIKGWELVSVVFRSPDKPDLDYSIYYWKKEIIFFAL